MARSYVYVVQCEQYLKVGTAADPARRLMGLQCGNPFELFIAYLIEADAEDAPLVECRAHRLLESYHHRNEWFDAPFEEVRQAIRRAYCEVVGTPAPADPGKAPDRTAAEWEARDAVRDGIRLFGKGSRISAGPGRLVLTPASLTNSNAPQRPAQMEVL